MTKPVLVIMAAGMGSRYGGLKQIDTVDEEGDKIIDFSLFDAKRAGFGKVVFVIKRENLDIFKEAVGNKVSEHIEVEYVFQDLADVPEGFAVPEGRTKPYGTAHAVRSARGVVNGPFAVINADDFYGREAFEKVYRYLCDNDDKKGNYCMVGFKLGNTLTENGSVSRGICETDNQGNLVNIVERTQIVKKGDGAAYTENGIDYVPIDTDSVTSMNLWGFTEDFMGALDEAFSDFYINVLPDNPEKAECYLPFVVGDMLKCGKAKVKVLTSSDKWFGVTYKEDKEYVRNQIGKLKELGEYPRTLWEDVK